MKNYLLVNRALAAETCFKRFLTLFFAAVLAVNVWGADITWTWTASTGALGTVKSYDASLTGSTSPSTPAENTKAWHVERSSVVYTGFLSSCIQFGSGSGAETVTLTSSAFSGTIKSVYVECSSYNNAHQVAISVGGTTYLSATNTAKWTTVSSKGGTGTSSGEIQIAFTPGSRALYIKSITVTYNKDSGTPVDPTITFNNGSYTIGGSNLDLTTLFSSNSSGAVTYSVSNANGTGATVSASGTDFSATTAGTCTVQASQAAVSGTYNAKTVTATITVTSGGGGGGSCSIFHETWDGCDGTGGNDGTWSGSIATSTVNADNSGWRYSGSKGGGKNCLKVGAGGTTGYATSPSITVSNGTAYTLNVKAAPWGTESCTLTVELTGAKFSDNTTSKTTNTPLSTQTWNSLSFDIVATSTSMSFEVTGSKNRFFLDEICIDVAGPTYTVTATVDDPAHGSVSVTGNTITVTPNPGWVPNSYTVTSGTATAVQSGNTFTVTPSSDCNIRINFRAAYTYTVTFVDNGGSYNETATEGVPFALPDEGDSNCDDATFLGWATGEYTNHLTGTSVAPTYDAPGTEKDITANTTFTAVYGTVAPSDNYAALKLESDLESGANYVLAAYYSDSDYAMNATMSNDRVDTEVKSLTIDDAGNAITDPYLIWRINVVNPSTKAVTFYNAEINKYLVINGSNELTFADDPIVFNYTVNTSGSAATWNFKSSSNAEYTLSFYTTYHQFNAYTSNSTNLYLYKQKIEVSNYTSKPQCCHEPGTPMAITSETTNFVGSGVATISLSGGNGKPITWTCKDEADTDWSSYLSGKSNTGATLTLPTNAATKVYTVTATQVDDETDPDNVICGATVTLNFTVKAQFTINFKTIDGGSESLYSSITVTDGDSYSMPNIAEDYDCGTSGKSFMGWASSSSATSVEKTAGTNVTATAAATWYACWSTSSDVTLVPLYEKVTSTSSLAAGDIVLICNTGATVAMGEQRGNNRDEASVTSYEEGGKEYVYFTGTDVHKLTVGKDESNFTFYDGGYLFAASSNGNYLRSQSPNDANGKWALSIAADGAATVTAQGTNTRNLMRYNTTSHIFSCYSSGQQAVVFYKKTTQTIPVSTGSGSITTDMDGCTSGPTIRANTNQWITSAAGQTVKTIIDVTARNFETAATLSATSSNAHFTITLAGTAVPAGNTGLTTTLTVEYTPSESDITESSTITLKAGDVTKTITVNGRSLPEEFLLITKKTLWYALPGNMSEGPGEYDGVVVTTDDPTTPTMVGVAPSTVLYSLKAVTSDRYDSYGNCVRLAGFKGSCLWSNMAEGPSTKINIQNKVNVATASGDNYEWLLTTTDGVQYTIANPHHPHYGAGRRLAYGAKFGLYTEPTIFYIVTAGCTSQPQEVNVGARRIDATFTWVSNTTDMHIDLYTNEAMTEGHIAATASSAPYVVTGLTETTDYWYKLTPGTDVACAVTGHFKTSGPIIDIVEWQENGVVLFIDKGDINPKIVIDGQEEHGSISGGGVATELFFAKYFEGAGNMKLLSIFNGTKNTISLANYKFEDYHAGSGAGSYGSIKTYDLAPLGSINAGQEIIFFSRPQSTETDLKACSDAFLDAMAEKSAASENPRWIECASGKFGDKIIEFNGNDALVLKKDDDIIDIIGALGKPAQGDNCKSEDAWEGTIKNMDKDKSPSDPAFSGLFEASSLSPVTTADSIAILNAFGINLVDEEIAITSARCIFFRDKRVTSGDSATIMNAGNDFKTFTTHIEGGKTYKAEWYGRSVCMTNTDKTNAGVSSDAKPTCNSYQDIANMNYNQYYIDWSNIDPGTELSDFSSDPETKEYTIPIDNMRQYACLKLRFQLVQGSEVLTEAAQQVPIVVAANADTNDPLFSELVIDKTTGDPSYSHSVERCKTCDVVVLGGITLTKGSDSDPKDVDEIANLKIYPDGKLIVPTSTEYTVKSLAFRRQEDAVASANIQGTLNIGKTDGTYLDFRIDPTNWHYFSLPYDCNVADIRFSNEEEVAVPVLGTDFLLKKYNGEKRAATQAGGCWEMVAADETLRKGIGYIFALPGSGKVKREFRFPMANAVITEDLANKEVDGVYGYGCDKDYTQVRANHRGWNLIGNPYLMPYTSDITNPLLIGKIVPDYSTTPWDGHFKFDDEPSTQLHYIVEPVDNGWSEYRQVAIADYEMTPFTSYFVQIGAADPLDPDPTQEQGIEFHATKISRSPVRRAPEEYEEVEDTHPVWCAVDITNSKDEKDETTLLISNDFTDNYDMMNDLVKMRGDYYQYAQITTKPVLASRNNEGEMAFNALPDASAVAGVPLNFFAAYQGTYTISYNDKFDRDNEVKEVKLLDTKDNKWYDLMSEPYEFTSGRENNTERFILSVRVERKKPQTPTGLEDIGYSETPRKILINGHVYIQRGNTLYDVIGKQLLNR